MRIEKGDVEEILKLLEDERDFRIRFANVLLAEILFDPKLYVKLMLEIVEQFRRELERMARIQG